jgi:uncharacterized membrane protein YccC
MTTTTGHNWQATLAEVERSIGDCLTALERYESAFARVLQEPTRTPISPPLQESVSRWDEHLAQAEERVDEVEELLLEQERVWGQWRQAFDEWQRSVNELPPQYVVRPPLILPATTSE